MKKQRGEVATAVLGVILLFAAGVAGLGPKLTQVYTDLCESAGYTYYPEALGQFGTESCNPSRE